MMFDHVSDQPVIDTARLTLRAVRKSDTALLDLYGGDERVAHNTTSIPHPLPPGSTATFIAQAQAPGRAEDIWIMDGTRAGLPEVVGVILLTRMDRQQSEIGYWVAPGFWNAGIASEAVEAMVTSNPHDARTLFGSVFQDNPASARVLTHVGFDYLGDAEAYSVARDANVATWTYSRAMV